MINLYRQDGDTLYGIKEFLLDSADDLSNLPTNLRSGSSALIIPTGELYIFNGNKQWVLMGGSTTSGGSTTDCSCEEVLNKIDIDNDGIVDMSEEAGAVVMYEM